jgi:hypothetical protein
MATFEGTYRRCAKCGQTFTSHGGKGQPWKYCPDCIKKVKADQNAERVRRHREKHPTLKPSPANRHEPGGAPVAFKAGHRAAPYTSRPSEAARTQRIGEPTVRNGMFADLPVDIANQRRRALGLPAFA